MADNAKRKRGKNNLNYYIHNAAALVIIAVLIFVVTVPSISAYRSARELMEYGLETTAVVTELRVVSRGRGRTETRVFVEYTVDDTVFRSRLRLAVRDTFVGEQVLIYYSPSDPNRITPVDRDRAVDVLWRLLLMPIFFTVILTPAAILLVASLRS